MSSRLQSFALSFYNFSSITALRYENLRYKISTFSTIANCLKIPILCFMIGLLTIHRELLAECLLPTLMKLENFSSFTKISISIITFLPDLFLVYLFISLLVTRKEIKNLLNNSLTFNMTNKYLKTFEKLCIHQSLTLLFVFLMTSIIQYYGSFQFGFIPMIFFIFFLYPTLMIFSFVSFIKTFENFIVASLEEFKDDLIKLSDRDEKLKLKMFQELSWKFRHINNLTEKFNKVCGLQITVFISYLTLM